MEGRRLWSRSHFGTSTFQSYNFLENTLIIWIILAIVLIIGCAYVPIKARKIGCGKATTSVMSNTLIRFFLIFYLPLAIACILNFFDTGSTPVIFRIIGFAAAAILVLFTLLVVFQTTLNSGKFAEEGHQVKFGTLVEGLKGSRLGRSFYGVYLVQRLLLAIVVVVVGAKSVQVGILAGIQFLLVLYLVVARPFQSNLTLTFHLLVESLFFIAIIILFLIIEAEGEQKVKLGGAFILAFLVAVIVSIAQLLHSIAQTC